MELSGRAGGLGMELLNQSNYKVWKTCIESYLVGEDFWEVVNGVNTSPPDDKPENANARKKWRQTNAKVEFILKRSVSHNLFDHIIRCKSAHEIWSTLDRLFNKKDEARLQILENELANTTQGNLSIAEYFLMIKNLCSEISLLNPDEAISEARTRRTIIRGLKPEYIPFVTSIQGWAQQPSLEEFENLLSSQELLAKQMQDGFCFPLKFLLLATRALPSPSLIDSNGVEFAWHLENKTQTLQVMVGARLDDETGWLAWGINFGPEPRMVGTRALIGIKQTNGSFIGDKYNITDSIKIGCMLLPSANDLNVSNLKFIYLEYSQYHIIEATIHLPQTVNVSRINHVWQVGKVAVGMEPKMHDKTLNNYDGTETIDLLTGKALSIRAARRHRARTAHGLLNIIGWGVILPIGVIIARYFRKGPINWNAHDQWKHAHKTCQTCGYIIGASGWVLGLWLGRASKYYSFPKHGAFGIFIFTFATLQAMALRLKPHKNDELHKYWDIYHHFLGYALLAVCCVNIFKGIKIIQEDEKWRPAYIAIVASLAFIFLVFEIINWLQFRIEALKKKKEIASIVKAQNT